MMRLWFGISHNLRRFEIGGSALCAVGGRCLTALGSGGSIFLGF